MLFLSALPLLNACSSDKAKVPQNQSANPVEINSIVVKPDSFSFMLEAAGTVLANEFVELKSEVAGRIVELRIREGEFVRKGDLLVQLFAEDLQANLSKILAQLELAQKTEQRLKKLLNAGGLNQQDYDAAQSQVITLDSDAAYIRAQIRKTEVRAPFDGVIGLRNVSVGAVVNAQETIATLQDITTLKVDFVLPESQSDVLKAGDQVSLRTGNNQTLTAAVVAVEPLVNSGTRNVKFRARILGGAYKLSPGAFVTVLIKRSKTGESILIPTNALIMESRNKKVAVIRNGKVAFQIVQTGYRGEEQAEILEGLSIGDTVAVSGLLFLKPDAAVQLKTIQ